jgi:hypothetical protein
MLSDLTPLCAAAVPHFLRTIHPDPEAALDYWRDHPETVTSSRWYQAGTIPGYAEPRCDSRPEYVADRRRTLERRDFNTLVG